MNKAIFCGRLTRDVEIHNGTVTVATFSLAVDRKYKKEGEPTADFFNCTSFGKQADFAQKYLKKGIKVIVTGRLQNDNYTNKNGDKVYSTQVITEEIEFAESKKAAGEESGGNTEWMNINDNIDVDLPFN